MKKKHKKSTLEVGTGLKIGLELELFLAANENENLILDQQSRIVLGMLLTCENFFSLLLPAISGGSWN